MIYEIIIFIASLFVRMLSIFDKKLKRFLSLRRGEIDRVEEFFRARKTERVIWFHSASAGEFEQAKPLIEQIRKESKEDIIIASFFSPSGYEAGLKYKKIDFCFNLPLDYKRNVRRLLDCINPSSIIYSKYDVWANLTHEAALRSIKMFLISASLPKKSFRYRFPFSLFFARSYSLLSRIYAVSDWDAKRLKRIVAKEESIIVSGDTRFDQIKSVLERSSIRKENIINNDEDSVIIIAGSTYSMSEKRLLSCINRVKREVQVRLVLVPHEVDIDNIKRLKKLVKSFGFESVCFSESATPITIKDNEILIVDALKVLALLYKEADIVFVGGSFKGSVHSVLEPAVFGKPIVTGPYIQNASEAIALRDIGGLKTCANNDELCQQIENLIMDKRYREDVSGVLLPSPWHPAGNFLQAALSPIATAPT